MKRQPTTCGSSPWQQVERPLAWRGVAPVWPIWFRCVRKGRTELAFAALVDQRFAAAQRCAGGAQEAENQLAGLGDVDLAVGLLLGPAGAGDEEQLRVGADGLRVLRWARGSR